jgi:hypothetical protein
VRRTRRRAIALVIAAPLAAGCGARSLSADAGSAGPSPATADADLAGVAPADAGAAAPVEGGPAAPAVPPAAPAGVTFRPCGAMAALPELLGVTAGGDVALVAGYQLGPAYVHLLSRASGRVTRTIEIDDSTALLTADRRHVMTPTSVVDLVTGATVRRATPSSGELAVGPAGDWVLRQDVDPSSGAVSIVKVDVTTDAHLLVSPALGAGSQVRDAAVTEDGARAVLLLATPTSGRNRTNIQLAVMALANGALERQLELDGLSGFPPAAVDAPSLQPVLTTAAGLALVHLTTGFRAYRIGDGRLMWSTGPDVNEAQLSPAGLIAFRGNQAASWELLDVDSSAGVGAFSADVRRSVDVGFVTQALLAFTPEGGEVVFVDDAGALRVGMSDGSTAPLPFKRKGWPGRSVFVSPSELVEIEGADFVGVNVRKRALPGGEILAERSWSEPQTEWIGDIALSSDGVLVAVALPDNVHVLRAADLGDVDVVPGPAGRVAWSHDGTALATTPDLHYRDMGRPPPVPSRALQVWSLRERVARSYALPFIPTYATFADDDRTIFATGRPTGTVLPDESSRVQLDGDLEAARIDRASGATAPAPALFGSDASRSFGTDLRSVYRLTDGAILSTLDLPAVSTLYTNLDADVTGFVDGLPPVAGIVTSHHRPVFSPDGALLADVTGLLPNGARLSIYETATGRRIDLEPPPRNVTDSNPLELIFSPDGRRLATEQWDDRVGTVRLLCASP